MRGIKTSILAVSLLAFAGTAGAVDWSAICCEGGYEYRHPSEWEKEQQRIKDELTAANKQLADRERELAALRAGAGDSSKLASQLSSTQAELAQAKGRNSDLERSLAAAGAGASASRLASGDTGKAAADRRIADLEKQLADREREMASLRAEQSTEMAKLKEAERGLVRSLRPQIEKGDITVDLNNERLLINLASAYLFDSGKGELKPDGAEALKHVGEVLKKFPQYKVAVDGHTDNVPIHGVLLARFPTNKELSEARAADAAKALADGGRGDAKTTGYGDINPVEPNTTAAGRAKNRRVEIRVTE